MHGYSGEHGTPSQGDVVYLLDGEDIIGNGPTVVKKGHVVFAEPRVKHPHVVLWEDPDVDPGNMGTTVIRASSLLFTTEQVAAALIDYAHPLSTDDRRIDEIVRDPSFNLQLVPVLAQAIAARRLRTVN